MRYPFKAHKEDLADAEEAAEREREMAKVRTRSGLITSTSQRALKLLVGVSNRRLRAGAATSTGTSAATEGTPFRASQFSLDGPKQLLCNRHGTITNATGKVTLGRKLCRDVSFGAPSRIGWLPLFVPVVLNRGWTWRPIERHPPTTLEADIGLSLSPVWDGLAPRRP